TTTGPGGPIVLERSTEQSTRQGEGEAAAGAAVVDEEASGKAELHGVFQVARALRDLAATAHLRIGILHGRMTAEEKDEVMRSFSLGDLDVLVATTVIEVGVDVPNATQMVVVDADRFGISQLHQLRGRIGRG